MTILSIASWVSRTAILRSDVTPSSKLVLGMIVAAYLALISIIAISVTCYDKWAAKNRPQKRTRESTLLLLSALGGSVAMLITMLLIRHKTKHLKFMIGIPVIIAVQAAIVFLVFRFFVL